MTAPILLVDANNLGFRSAFANRHLSYNGMSTGLLFGFLKSLIMFYEEWPGAHIIVAFESKSRRRMAESTKAIEDGILTKELGAYKENRKKDGRQDEDEYQNALSQLNELDEVLPWTLAQCVRVDGFEADDVIGSYSKKAVEMGFEAIVISSDQDFYQLINKKVHCYDAMKKELWDLRRFQLEFGIEPEQWVEVGALSGDSGDNIHGVPGIGIKTALKLIETHKDTESVIEYLTGVKEEGKKLKKRESSILEFQNRVRLAKSLKAIDCDVDVPEIGPNRPDKKKFVEWLGQVGFKSLIDRANILTRRRA